MRNQYSQPFLNTLLMHLWKQLQPRVFFQCDATSLAHLSLGSFAHSSVQHLSSSLRWNEKHWCSLQRCSLGIQCGFWLGRSLSFIHTVVPKPLLISRLCAWSRRPAERWTVPPPRGRPQVNLCLTWPENFVSHDPWILLANLKAGLCLRWTFHATWEQTGLSCASTRTRNNVFPLDVLVIANVLPVVTDTFFSGVQNGIDIWFHALQCTALICPATYILNLWHKDYLQRELLCCVSSFLILSRCEPSGGCGSASKAVT